MRHNTPIEDFYLPTKVNTGIEVEWLPGLIPLNDEIAACSRANYCYWDSWQDLTERQKARLIAEYYLQILITSNVEDAKARAVEKRGKR